jgi:hypothetical protein
VENLQIADFLQTGGVAQAFCITQAVKLKVPLGAISLGVQD